MYFSPPKKKHENKDDDDDVVTIELKHSKQMKTVKIAKIADAHTAKKEIEKIHRHPAARVNMVKKLTVPEEIKVEMTQSAIILRKAAMEANFAIIFNHWDSNGDYCLDLREIQAGLFRGGILIDHRHMLRILSRVHKIAPKPDEENDDANDDDNGDKNEDERNLSVSVDHFHLFMNLLCNDDIDILEQVVDRMMMKIPSTKMKPSGFLTLRRGTKKKIKQSLANNVTKKTRELVSGKSGNSKEREGTESSTKSDADDDDDKKVNVGKTFSGSHSTLGDFEKSILEEGTVVTNALILDPWRVFTLQKGLFPAFIAFVVWQFSFTLWYVLYCDFRFSRAFYYSAQAGLSVGFGALSEEVKGGVMEIGADCSVSNVESSSYFDVSKAMTILNVLLGSSIIGGALGHFVNSALEKRQAWYEALRRIDGGGNQDGKDSSYIQTITSPSGATKLIAIVLTLLACATVYGMVHEEWSFISSVYYGITAMSTAGLQAPNPGSDFGMMFTGLLVLFGVPLYAVCLGMFANVLVQKAVEKRREKKFRGTVSKAEFNYAKKVGHIFESDGVDAPEELSRKDFFSMEVLRTGKCDVDFLEKAEALFERFDMDESGRVSWMEITASNVFDRIDQDQTNLIDFEEFKLCMSKLPENIMKTIGGDERTLKLIFDFCDTSRDGHINRREFIQLVSKLSHKHLDALLDYISNGNAVHNFNPKDLPPGFVLLDDHIRGGEKIEDYVGLVQ